MQKFYLNLIRASVFLLVSFSACTPKTGDTQQAQTLKKSEKITFQFAYADSLIANIMDSLSITQKSPNYLVITKSVCMTCTEQILEACINADKELCVVILGAPIGEIIKNNVIFSRRSKIRFAFTHPALYDSLEAHDKRMANNLIYSIKRSPEGKMLTFNNMQIYASELKPDAVIKFLLTN
jgi:hypothetical protein